MAHTITDKLGEAQLERLFVRLEKPIFNVVYRWLWDLEESADVVQEAFMKLWQMRERIRMETVQPLLFQIALNLARNRRRRRRLWKWVSLGSVPESERNESSPESRALGHERAHRVRQAIEDLPEALRSVVTLCAFSEMTYEEIADALKIPAGTVASRRNTAIRKLGEALGDKEVQDAVPA